MLSCFPSPSLGAAPADSFPLTFPKTGRGEETEMERRKKNRTELSKDAAKSILKTETVKGWGETEKECMEGETSFVLDYSVLEYPNQYF